MRVMLIIVATHRFGHQVAADMTPDVYRTPDATLYIINDHYEVGRLYGNRPGPENHCYIVITEDPGVRHFGPLMDDLLDWCNHNNPEYIQWFWHADEEEAQRNMREAVQINVVADMDRFIRSMREVSELTGESFARLFPHFEVMGDGEVFQFSIPAPRLEDIDLSVEPMASYELRLRGVDFDAEPWNTLLGRALHDAEAGETVEVEIRDVPES